MAQFNVYPQAAGAGGTALTEAGRTLEDLREQARRVYQRLVFQIRCREDLARRLEGSIRSIERQGEDAHRLAAGISKAMERYRAAESDILRQTWGIKDVGGGAVAADVSQNGTEGQDLWVSWGEMLLESLGFLGTAGSSILDVWAEWLTETRGKLGNAVSATAAKWAGVAFSALANLSENIEEYGWDFSNVRLYAETIGQTAVDVGLGAAATAGIGAGVAALGITAPAWAIAAAGVVVVAGANWGVEALTGKNLTEHISDFAIDAAETISDLAVEAADAVCDWAGDVWDGLTGLFA